MIEMPFLAKHQDDNGDYPLPLAIKHLVKYLKTSFTSTFGIYDKTDPSVLNYIKTLIQLNPMALAKPLSSNRRLPLHICLGGDLNCGMWDRLRASACVDALLEAAPGTLAARDPVTGLYPFMLAAVGDRRSLMGDRVDLGLVYILLRRDPSVIDTS